MQLQEDTTLESQSIDLITVGQAFHWFNAEKSKSEFQRITCFPSWVVLIWNERRVDTYPFVKAYEELVQKYATNHHSLGYRSVGDEGIRKFFNPHKFVLTTLPNRQNFDFEGLKGRLSSSSYAPNIEHYQYLPMIAELEQIFKEHNKEGKVVMEYQTKVYCGQINT